MNVETAASIWRRLICSTPTAKSRSTVSSPERLHTCHIADSAKPAHDRVAVPQRPRPGPADRPSDPSSASACTRGAPGADVVGTAQIGQRALARGLGGDRRDGEDRRHQGDGQRRGVSRRVDLVDRGGGEAGLAAAGRRRTRGRRSRRRRCRGGASASAPWRSSDAPATSYISVALKMRSGASPPKTRTRSASAAAASPPRAAGSGVPLARRRWPDRRSRRWRTADPRTRFARRAPTPGPGRRRPRGDRARSASALARRPAVGGRIVHLVGVGRAVAGAAERVEAAVEHRDGERAARGRHRRRA